MRKYVSWVLIAAGLIIIAIAIFQEVSTIYNQKKLINEYSKYVDTLKKLEISEMEAEKSGYNETDAVPGEDTEGNIPEPIIVEPEINEAENNSTQETINENSKSTEPDLSKIFEGKQISGVIEIPKINVNAAILEGTDDSALKYAVGHYPGLGEVGQPGNYVLLGHRNYVYGHFFRSLDKLEVGDEVRITKDEKTYIYVVYESFVVKPEEVWVLEQTENAIITMITCTPIGTYTDRLIVRGALFNE